MQELTKVRTEKIKEIESEKGNSDYVLVTARVEVAGKGGGTIWWATVDSFSGKGKLNFLPKFEGFEFYSTRSYSSLRSGKGIATAELKEGTKIIFKGTHASGWRCARIFVRGVVKRGAELKAEDQDGTRYIGVFMHNVEPVRREVVVEKGKKYEVFKTESGEIVEKHLISSY